MRIEEIPDPPHVFKFTDAMEHCSQELRPVSLTQVVISRIELMNDKFSQESSNNLQFKVPESSLQLVERFKYSDIPEISSQELRPVGLVCTVIPRSQLVVKNICPMCRHTYAIISRIKSVNDKFSQVESNDNLRSTGTLEYSS